MATVIILDKGNGIEETYHLKCKINYRAVSGTVFSKSSWKTMTSFKEDDIILDSIPYNALELVSFSQSDALNNTYYYVVKPYST
jgi:hypothetical protein